MRLLLSLFLLLLLVALHLPQWFLLLLRPPLRLFLFPLFLHQLFPPLPIFLFFPLLLPQECARQPTRDVDEEGEGWGERMRSTEKIQAKLAHVVKKKELYFLEVEEMKQERRG